MTVCLVIAALMCYVSAIYRLIVVNDLQTSLQFIAVGLLLNIAILLLDISQKEQQQ